MIRMYEVDRVRILVHRSGVADLLDAELHQKGLAGRKSPVSVEDWLVCLILTAIHGRTLHSTEVRRMFTDLSMSPLDVQLALGTRTCTSGNAKDDRVASASPFEARLRILGERLAYLPSSFEPGTMPGPDELERRQAALENAVRRLCKASQPNDLPPTGAMIADGTALETYGQMRVDGADPDARPGHRTPKLSELPKFNGYMYVPVVRTRADGQVEEIPGPRLFENFTIRPGNMKGGVGEPILPFLLDVAAQGLLQEILLDAAWFNTTKEAFWYPLQEAGVRVIVPPSASMKTLHQWQGNPLWYPWPLCPATPDDVLDLARTLKRPAALCLVPGFSDEELEELAARDDDIEPIDLGIMTLSDVPEPADRLEEDAAEYDDDGAAGAADDDDPRWWDGLHKRPFAERKQALKESRQRVYDRTKAYLDGVEQVQKWALVRKESATAQNGWTERFECPAKSGGLRCPFYEPSLDYDEDKVPTAQPHLGGFCGKTRLADMRDKAVRDGDMQPGTEVHVLTLKLPREVRPKVRSKHFIGTLDYLLDIMRRGGIEGDFGVLKSRAGTGLGKGYFAVGGLVQYGLLGGIVAAARNYLNTHAWIARGGTTDDPVFAPAPEMHGFAELNEEQAATVRTAVLKAKQTLDAAA